MPYIKQENRTPFLSSSEFLGKSAKSPGELNYIFTKIIYEYLNSRGINYSNINEVIGVLECCKLELYRKIAVTYEDQKELENGKI